MRIVRPPLMQVVQNVRRRLFVISAVFLAACGLGQDFQGLVVDPPRDLPTLEFLQAEGGTYQTTPEKNHLMVFFFGYTHCPDVCPTTLADWNRVKDRLGEKAERVRFIFVTVDPERDTPAVVERYAKQYDESFVGLSGDSLTTARIMDAFGVAAFREEAQTASGYLVSHSAQVFLVNDKGHLVTFYPFGMSWEALAADLERLL